MVRTLGISILILFYSLQAAAVEAVVSHTLFYQADPVQANKLQPMLEAYWQVNPRTLHYTTTPQGGIIARIRTDIFFTNEQGTVREDHFILETVPRTSVEELGRHSIIDLRRYALPAGTIKMRFILTDLKDSTRRFTYADSFVIAPVPATPFYSELQLLDTTIISAAATAFVKNGKQQVPACINFLDEKKPLLHYYAELYKLNEVAKGYYPLVQKVSINRKETETPGGYFLHTDTVTAASTAIAGTFDITSLASGNYYLCIALQDKNRNIIASNTLFFQRMNPHPAPEPQDTSKKSKTSTAASDTGMENVNVLNLNKTFVGKYSLAEVRAILKMMLPVSDPVGVKTINGFLKKPDDMYMRYFIYNYFSAINKDDPGKAWKEYTNRVKDVNGRFTARGIAGYETERGYIYLRYGAPTEIVSVQNESGTEPYEIWQYNILTETTQKEKANAFFLFYKPSKMMSDYRLLHSNVTGEVQNPTWRRDLYLGEQGGTSLNSRAEQYIGSR